MLSPGKYHEWVPRGLAENLAFRKAVLEEAEKNPNLRRGLVEMCRRDILFYVNAFVWQFNPNEDAEDEVGPFITWECQDEAFLVILECLHERRDLVIEKSREMGASWMCLIAMEWVWHFHKWKKFLCISRKLEAVEAADPDSLFWKLDFVHSHQPHWLLPCGSPSGIMRQHKTPYFGNLETHSRITGAASTGDAGVGGRATGMFIDEFPRIKEDYDVLHSTSDTTRCRIFNGTHRGTDTAFNELCDRVDIRKLRLHWSQHPEKRKGLYKADLETGRPVVVDTSYQFPPDYPFVLDGSPTGGPYPGLRSPWYDYQCQRKGSPRAIAMDLDIDPRGSTAQVFSPLLIRELIDRLAMPPFWEGDVVLDHRGKFRELTRCDGGPLQLWCPLGPGNVPPPGKYGAGADISTGQSATPSVISFVDAKSGEKVAMYTACDKSPTDLAVIAVALCWLFGEGEGALFAWELQGPGVPFGVKVLEMGYRNVYYRTPEHHLDPRASDSPGWNSTPDGKRALLEQYAAALKSRLFVNRSELALRECLDFRYTQTGRIEHSREQNKDDPAGARENHGDRVIADALAWKMVKSMGVARGVRKMESVPDGSFAWRRKIRERREKEEEAWS